MTLFTRAFSYASEPFFFKHADRSDALRLYAVVAKYFAIAGTAIFLLVMLYMDIIQYFIGANRYREGLGVVPILLLANLCLGLYYNVAIWYKNTDNTIYGTYISIFGAVITLALNFILIPRIGYMGSAWATLACYASMLIAAWYLGRKKYPVPYPVGKILIYIYVMFGMYAASDLFAEKLDTGMFLRLVFNTGLMAFYIWFVVRNEAINVKALILELKGKIPGFKKST
jgi:O-antigen/teichoic acid export membrane protein